MRENQDFLSIYLTPSQIYKLIYNFNQEENNINFKDASLLEFRSFSTISKALSKREQCEILDLIRKWIKNFHSIQNCKIIISEEFKEIEGWNFIAESLKSQFNLEIKEFTIEEECRQSFLGFKYDLIINKEDNPRSILQLNIKNNETTIIIGDLQTIHKVSTLNFSTKNIIKFIEHLKKTHEASILHLFLKSNILNLIENDYLINNKTLLILDENTSYLLTKIFNLTISPQRINSDIIVELAEKIVDSNFEYFQRAQYMDSESLIPASAQIILLSTFIENFNIRECFISFENRLKGFVINENIEKLQGEYFGHIYDWQRSAKEVLFRNNPSLFLHSLKSAELSSKIFDSLKDQLHFWGEKEKKLLWIACFFQSYCFKLNLEARIEILKKIHSLSSSDCQLIANIISLAEDCDLISQSKYLSRISADSRNFAKQISSLIQIANALDISKRSAVKDLNFSINQHEKIILKLFSREKISPELIQLNFVKKNFENAFEYKLEIEIENLNEDFQFMSQNTLKEIF